MPINKVADVGVSPDLLDAITSLPTTRTVSHCGAEFAVSPLDIYAACPQCGKRIKVRSFAAAGEVEDVFDAVLAWMLQPGAEELARRRQAIIAADDD